ncbi:type II toxin-antitoxin system HicB family antitoxin [Anaerococcus tetradius]|uniref:Toxin-antitoxin system, antitoxin component, HicB family n=1 Tax=Anaerococcus tetradius ATCC 35098 TaxID=525255 RepID=C2CFH5_9FIRM|nr:type II toxin-antitoxin system HicB family antitoxin [Anaerococcus tetradius]EEI83674.1 toxin-antitoxin system, antitoxin component, HicB family [Anaerococcus tetradius ATCC 35098]
MFINYPAIFLKEKDSESYTVIFPDLEGCISWGDSVNDALRMAQDALGAYLFEYYTKPNEMPKSSSIDDIEIKIDEDDKEYFSHKGSFKNYVSLDLTDYVKKSNTKTVKKTLSIPSYLNEAGIENNVNFSLLLQEALRKELKIN